MIARGEAHGFDHEQCYVAVARSLQRASAERALQSAANLRWSTGGVDEYQLGVFPGEYRGDKVARGLSLGRYD